jgi:hypothetical protein
MDPDEDISVVTNDHLLLFGGIIHGFARIDGVLQAALSAVSGVGLDKIAVFMRELGYGARRDTLYSYMVLFETKAEIQKAIRDFVREADDYSGLRNHIAHSYWAKGVRPNSIRPASLKVRGGKGQLQGYDDSDKDYLPEELAMIADKLRIIHNSLIQFLKSEALLVEQ